MSQIYRRVICGRFRDRRSECGLLRSRPDLGRLAGIWKAVPKITIDIQNIFTCADAPTCVVNILVVVDESTTLNVCDVFEFDADGLVVSLKAYKA